MEVHAKVLIYSLGLIILLFYSSVMVTLRGFGTFNISGSLYTSDLFDTLFDETEFPIMICDGILVYFGIQVELNDPTLELFTENCYASESDDPYADVVHYNMIVNGYVVGVG